MTPLTPVLATLAILAGTLPAVARSAPTVLLLPLDNVARASGVGGAGEALAAALARKGWTLAPRDGLDEILRAERVRYLDSVPTPVLARIAAKQGADVVMLVSVLVLSDFGPEVSLGARVVSASGGLVWSGVVTQHGQDTEGAFGRGRVTDRRALEQLVAARLVEQVPADGGARVRVASRSAGKLPTRYRASGFLSERRRVAILPIANRGTDRSGARVADALLRIRLGEREEIDVVEPADLRAALVAERVLAPSAATPDELVRVGQRVGTSLFVRGAVHLGPRSEELATELYLSMFDARSGRMLWSSLHARKAADFEPLLGIRPVRSSVEVADRAVTELVEALLRK